MWSDIPISLKNFPQFVVIHTVKGYSIFNKTELDGFLEFSSFFYDPTDIGNFTSGQTDTFGFNQLWLWY